MLRPLGTEGCCLGLQKQPLVSAWPRVGVHLPNLSRMTALGGVLLQLRQPRAGWPGAWHRPLPGTAGGAFERTPAPLSSCCTVQGLARSAQGPMKKAVRAVEPLPPLPIPGKVQASLCGQQRLQASPRWMPPLGPDAPTHCLGSRRQHDEACDRHPTQHQGLTVHV